MIDEEMAEKYAKGNMHYEIAKRENGADYAKEVSNVTIKQAFLAGLEFERYLTLKTWNILYYLRAEITNACGEPRSSVKQENELTSTS